MKSRISLFLIVSCLIGYTQQPKPFRLVELKQEILQSKEAIDWQNAVINYQKSNTEFCALKYEQKQNQNLFDICGKNSNTKMTEDFMLQLFRTMRITDQMKDSVKHKEKALRARFPELATHFEFDEIFPELYAPIEKSRKRF